VKTTNLESGIILEARMIEVKFSFENPFCSVDLFDVCEVLFTNIMYLHK